MRRFLKRGRFPSPWKNSIDIKNSLSLEQFHGNRKVSQAWKCSVGMEKSHTHEKVLLTSKLLRVMVNFHKDEKVPQP